MQLVRTVMLMVLWCGSRQPAAHAQTLSPEECSPLGCVADSLSIRAGALCLNAAKASAQIARIRLFR